jgi:hypothetical protein
MMHASKDATEYIARGNEPVVNCRNCTRKVRLPSYKDEYKHYKYNAEEAVIQMPVKECIKLHSDSNKMKLVDKLVATFTDTVKNMEEVRARNKDLEVKLMEMETVKAKNKEWEIKLVESDVSKLENKIQELQAKIKEYEGVIEAQRIKNVKDFQARSFVSTDPDTPRIEPRLEEWPKIWKQSRCPRCLQSPFKIADDNFCDRTDELKRGIRPTACCWTCKVRIALPVPERYQAGRSYMMWDCESVHVVDSKEYVSTTYSQWNKIATLTKLLACYKSENEIHLLEINELTEKLEQRPTQQRGNLTWDNLQEVLQEVVDLVSAFDGQKFPNCGTILSKCATLAGELAPKLADYNKFIQLRLQETSWLQSVINLTLFHRTLPSPSGEQDATIVKFCGELNTIVDLLETFPEEVDLEDKTFYEAVNKSEAYNCYSSFLGRHVNIVLPEKKGKSYDQKAADFLIEKMVQTKDAWYRLDIGKNGKKLKRMIKGTPCSIEEAEKVRDVLNEEENWFAENRSTKKRVAEEQLTRTETTKKLNIVEINK